MGPEPEDVPQVLEQGAAVHPHEGHHPQGQQSDGHDHHPDGAGQGDPQQLRHTHQKQQEPGLYRVPGFHHAPQQLAGIGVVGGDGVDVADFFFFQGCTSSDVGKKLHAA